MAGTGGKDSAKACGDPVAFEVLRQAAADLVEFVLLVRAKLRKKHPLLGEASVAWTGGIIEKNALVREAFFAGLEAAAPQMPVSKIPVVPLEGALWRAERLAETAN